MGDADTVYAEGGDGYSIDMNLKRQFDRWLSGEMGTDDYFNLGRTPESLKKFGANDLQMLLLATLQSIQFATIFSITGHNFTGCIAISVKGMGSRLKKQYCMKPSTRFKMWKDSQMVLTHITGQKTGSVLR